MAEGPGERETNRRLHDSKVSPAQPTYGGRDGLPRTLNEQPRRLLPNSHRGLEAPTENLKMGHHPQSLTNCHCSQMANSNKQLWGAFPRKDQRYLVATETMNES